MAEVRVAPLTAGADGGALVRVGDVLVVELPENATTGWVWDVDAVPEQLVPLAPGDAAEGLAPGRAGAGSGRVLRFAVRAAGAGELRLRHGRPWQPDRADLLAVRVQAEPAT